MPWNDPNEAPWDVGNILTSDSLKDYVRDNLLALRSLNYAALHHNHATGVSTTSTTFVNMDASNLKVELEISSTRLLCIASLMVDRPNSGGVAQGIGYLDLAVNQDASSGTLVRASNQADGLVKYNSFDLPIILVGYWTDLDPGNKQITIQARTNNASYATSILNKLTINMLALEV